MTFAQPPVPFPISTPIANTNAETHTGADNNANTTANAASRCRYDGVVVLHTPCQDKKDKGDWILDTPHSIEFATMLAKAVKQTGSKLPIHIEAEIVRVCCACALVRAHAGVHVSCVHAHVYMLCCVCTWECTCCVVLCVHMGAYRLCCVCTRLYLGCVVCALACVILCMCIHICVSLCLCVRLVRGMTFACTAAECDSFPPALTIPCISVSYCRHGPF